MAQSRIYKVEAPDQTARLVRANTKSQAVNHVIRNTVSATVASQDELVSMLQAGAVIEQAKAEPEPAEPEPEPATAAEHRHTADPAGAHSHGAEEAAAKPRRSKSLFGGASA